MRKRREPTITVTIRGAEAAWRLLASKKLSEKRGKELLDVIIKETSPQEAYMALKHERARTTCYPEMVKDALVKVILDSGIDAPVYLCCIMTLDPPTKYRPEVIEAFASRSPSTAMLGLGNAREFGITVSERDMLIRRVLSPKRQRDSKASDATRILASFGLPASAQRHELVKAAAFPTERFGLPPAFKILKEQKKYFSAEPPTEGELKALAAGAYARVHNAPDWKRPEELKELLDIPDVIFWLTSEQLQFLRQSGEKKK